MNELFSVQLLHSIALEDRERRPIPKVAVRHWRRLTIDQYGSYPFYLKWLRKVSYEHFYSVFVSSPMSMLLQNDNVFCPTNTSQQPLNIVPCSCPPGAQNVRKINFHLFFKSLILHTRTKVSQLAAEKSVTIGSSTSHRSANMQTSLSGNTYLLRAQN